MSAQHLRIMVDDFQRAHSAIGMRMCDPEWLNEAWGTQLDCDGLNKRMCEALADGDDAQVGALLRDALNSAATREVSRLMGVDL